MKDFIQQNFAELLLTLILVVIATVLLFCIHWHADDVAKWAMGTITAIIVGLTTILNSLKQPRPNGTSTVTNTTEPDPTKETK